MSSHKHSRLLTQEENDFVFELFPKRCLSMCTAVVELFTTEPADHSRWIKYSTGVLCYVKDSSHKSYFFRLFCLLENRLIWEQENYSNIELIKAKPYLLTFEGNNEIVGVNFACENEAAEFYEIASKKAKTTARTRSTRRAPSIRKSQPTIVPEERVILRNVPKVPSHQAPIHEIKLAFNENRKKVTKKKVNKLDIGMPTGFVHVDHAGLDAPGGLSEFLKKAGVTENQINDRETKMFIEDFIKKNDVESCIKKDSLHKAPPPPVRMPKIPAPIYKAPKENSGGPAPPPPPPPPMMDSPNAPPPPPPGNMLSLPRAKPPPVEEDNRSALLDSIRLGKNLKKVNKEEIRDSTEPSTAPAAISESDALSIALKRALQNRGMAMRSENEDSDDSRGDDWE